jgi:serine/threonine-protein kinase
MSYAAAHPESDLLGSCAESTLSSRAEPRASTLSSRAEPRASTSIGPYRIVRELGRGGMGLVHEAVHRQLGRRVAIKTLRSHLLEDDAHIRRFVREGRAACRVAHPHVVEIFELGSHAGAPYLVMDLCEGIHLGAHLEQQGPLPLSLLIELMLPILAAVSAAHAAGVVHRDLKPSNIMLARGRDGAISPKVLDFGTSKLREQEPQESLTVSGTVLGTLHYMAPEQARAPKDADARSDQYSLALILYECATGKKPFLAESVYEILRAIMTRPVAAPSALRADLPAAFDAVVMRAMSRAARDRYPSVAALGLALLPLASAEARERWQRELLMATESDLAPAHLPSPVSPLLVGDVETLSAVDRVKTLAPLRSKLTPSPVLNALLVGAAVLCLRADTRASTAGLSGTFDEQRGLLTAPPSLEQASAARPSDTAPLSTSPSWSPAPARAEALLSTEASEQGASALARPRMPTRRTRDKVERPRPAARIELGDNDAPILE